MLTFAPRSFVFKKGDDDSRALFVLEGRIDLVCDGQLIKSVEGGTAAAASVLAQVTPRRLAALSRTAAVVVAFDSATLERPGAPAPGVPAPAAAAAKVEVAEIEQHEAVDWMTRLLQSKLLSSLPAANIQQLFARMEAVEVEAGEVVAREGEPGVHYHVVREGRCIVSRHPSGDEGSSIKLAELAEGDGFGEEALIAGGAFGATVRMRTSGTLMRLSRQDFETLVRIPCTNALDAPRAVASVEDGALWLDVRQPGTGKHPAPDDALSVPMSTLAMRAQRLDPSRRYVTLCDTGEVAATAAFVLVQHGLEASYLVRGLRVLGGLIARGASSDDAPGEAVEHAPGPPAGTAPAIGAAPAGSPTEHTAGESEARPANRAAASMSGRKARAFDAGETSGGARPPRTKKATVEATPLEASPPPGASTRPKPTADKARLDAARRSFERRVQSERARLAERERESERRLAAAITLKDQAEAEREALSRNLEDSLRSSREQLECEASRADTALAEVERLKAEVDSARRVAARERGVKEARERELESLRQRAEARFASEEERIRQEQRRHADELTDLRGRREDLERELETVRGRLDEAEDSRRVAEVEARREREAAQGAASAEDGPAAEFARTREDLKRALAAERSKVRAERERLEAQADRLQALLDEVRRMREEADACRRARAPAAAPPGSDASLAAEQTPAASAGAACTTHAGAIEADEYRVLARERRDTIKRAAAGGRPESAPE